MYLYEKKKNYKKEASLFFERARSNNKIDHARAAMTSRDARMRRTLLCVCVCVFAVSSMATSVKINFAILVAIFRGCRDDDSAIDRSRVARSRMDIGARLSSFF